MFRIPLILEGPASRVALLIELHDQQEEVELWVQAGWSNGQFGPWVQLELQWSEGRQRVLAASLNTSATELKLRLRQPERLFSLSVYAALPLAPSVRGGEQADIASATTTGALNRAEWGATPAVCGAPGTTVDRVQLRGSPKASVSTEAGLRALQAVDKLGLLWCDLRASYTIDSESSWVGRAPRQAPQRSTQDAETRLEVLVVGCEDKQTARASLQRLLNGLIDGRIIKPQTQYSIGKGGCENSSWLQEELDAWLATKPFAPVLEPPPPPPPPPPPMKGALRGVLWDSSTGDMSSGTRLEAVEVVCSCGVTARSASDGSWSFTADPGDYVIGFSKMGFVTENRTVTVVADEEESLTVGLQPEVVMNPGVSVIDHDFLIEHWGGQAVDPMQYPQTQAGFQQYLDAVGVTHFAAWEYVVPNNQTVASNCGYSILLPDRSIWPRGAALGLLADRLRALVAEPVTLRNWWRPPCYNAGVGGAAGGDHPDADALDLDFRNNRSRADAQRFLCDTYWNQDIVAPGDIAPGSGLNPRLNMSLGLGGVTMHLGLLSRNGRRFWKYNSYTTESNSGNCW